MICNIDWSLLLLISYIFLVVAFPVFFDERSKPKHSINIESPPA